MKELELLTACALGEEPAEILTPKTQNLSIPDPKTQNEIDRMDPKDAKRFNDATISKVNGRKSKNFFKNTTMATLRGTM
jgi:hypothetical protein